MARVYGERVADNAKKSPRIQTINGIEMLAVGQDPIHTVIGSVFGKSAPYEPKAVQGPAFLTPRALSLKDGVMRVRFVRSTWDEAKELSAKQLQTTGRLNADTYRDPFDIKPLSLEQLIEDVPTLRVSIVVETRDGQVALVRQTVDPFDGPSPGVRIAAEMRRDLKKGVKAERPAGPQPRRRVADMPFTFALTPRLVMGHDLDGSEFDLAAILADTASSVFDLRAGEVAAKGMRWTGLHRPLYEDSPVMTSWVKTTITSKELRERIRFVGSQNVNFIPWSSRNQAREQLIHFADALDVDLYRDSADDRVVSESALAALHASLTPSFKGGAAAAKSLEPILAMSYAERKLHTSHSTQGAPTETEPRIDHSGLSATGAPTEPQLARSLEI